ncbi:hypothetical protein C9426_30075 [Serratia sp. S1B]|nr:hypothetical protein C9426_30075 [Serratia sp. S1B]
MIVVENLIDSVMFSLMWFVCHLKASSHKTNRISLPLINRFRFSSHLALTKGDGNLPLDGLLKNWESAIVGNAELHPFGEEYVFINQARTYRDLVSHTPNLRSLSFDIATLRQRYARV